MVLNELLIMIHTRGFRDELDNNDCLELIKRAYNLGKLDALAGDDVRSVDQKTNEDILKQIYGE